MFKVGDEVMQTNKENCPRGKIVKVNGDGTYLIEYAFTKSVGKPVKERYIYKF